MIPTRYKELYCPPEAGLKEYEGFVEIGDNLLPQFSGYAYRYAVRHHTLEEWAEKAMHEYVGECHKRTWKAWRIHIAKWIEENRKPGSLLMHYGKDDLWADYLLATEDCIEAFFLYTSPSRREFWSREKKFAPYTDCRTLFLPRDYKLAKGLDRDRVGVVALGRDFTFEEMGTPVRYDVPLVSWKNFTSLTREECIREVERLGLDATYYTANIWDETLAKIRNSNNYWLPCFYHALYHRDDWFKEAHLDWLPYPLQILVRCNPFRENRREEVVESLQVLRGKTYESP